MTAWRVLILLFVLCLPGQVSGQQVPPAGAGQETLEDAWRVALENDQQLESRHWNVASAQSTWAGARAERLPSLTLGADYLALSEQPSMSVSLPVLGSQQFPIWERDSLGFQGLVKQPLYTSGRITSGICAAEAGVRAHQAEVVRAQLDVKINVAEIYVTVLRAARIVEVAESKVASLTGHTRMVADHFDKGVVSKNDLLAAQVALADACQQSLEAHNGLELSRAAYNRALGRQLTETVQLAELLDDDATFDVDQLTGMALQQRPELAALSAQATALREQAAGTQAKLAPQAALMGGYVYQQNQYMDPNGLGVLGVGVEWNAFDSGRVRNQADALCRKAESVLRMRKDAESQIALEVRQKWLDLQTARQRVQVARQATAQADENLRVAQNRYQQQAGTNTEVLDAESLRVQAFTNLYNSSYQSVLAGLRLRRAVGSL